MELEDLVGGHVLDAVDFSNEQVKTWGDRYEDCQVVRFRLDGVVYIATEDPSDGYRSRMQNLTTGDWNMNNVFQPHHVLAVHRTQGVYGLEDDILELYDTITGDVILTVGTEHVHDYYPSFVASFSPTAMALNQTSKHDEQENVK